MTQTARLHPEDFYDSDACRELFCEWLSPDSKTDLIILAAAQAASVGHVPQPVLAAEPWEFCEFVHNVLIADRSAYDGLIDHLMETLQDIFQAEHGFWDSATLWSYEMMLDMAADWLAE